MKDDDNVYIFGMITKVFDKAVHGKNHRYQVFFDDGKGQYFDLNGVLLLKTIFNNCNSKPVPTHIVEEDHDISPFSVGFVVSKATHGEYICGVITHVYDPVYHNQKLYQVEFEDGTTDLCERKHVSSARLK